MSEPMNVDDPDNRAQRRRDSLARLEAVEQRFAARQRVSRRWVPLIWVVRLFDERIGPEGCGYDHLTKAVRAGIFNRDGRSQLLLFDRVVSGPDGSYSAVPRRLDLDEVEALLAATPADLSPVTVLCNQRLRYCWAPADLLARWLEDHGLPRPPEWFGDLSGNTQALGASRSGATIETRSRKRRKPSGADYREADKVLVQEMHEGILSGCYRNPTDAARKIAKRAVGGGTENSKATRLITRYSDAFRTEHDRKD